MSEQEKELLECFKKLPPELQNFILSTATTAVTAQEAALREFQKNAESESILKNA